MITLMPNLGAMRGRAHGRTLLFTLAGAKLVAQRCGSHHAERATEFILFLDKLERTGTADEPVAHEAAPAPAPSPHPFADMPLSLLIREWWWGGRHV